MLTLLKTKYLDSTSPSSWELQLPLQEKAQTGLGQYGPLEGFLKKNLGAGMANGMMPVSDGLEIVGAVGRVGRKFARVASGSAP